MPDVSVAKKLLDFLQKAPSVHPKATGTTLGALTGGAAGGLFSEEGATPRGILQGALLGGGAGLGVSALRELPLAASALAAVPVGWAARRKLSPLRAEELREEREEAKRQRLRREMEEDRERAEASPPGWPEGMQVQASHENKDKENTLMSAEIATQWPKGLEGAQKNAEFIKKALKEGNESEKAAETDAERLMAFDLGMEVFCEANGISKEALAKACDVPEEELAVRTAAFLGAQAEQLSE